MGKDTGAARKAPATHSDAVDVKTITPEEHARAAADAKAKAETPAEPYRKGDFMGKPFHQCPHCPQCGTTHEFIERHIAKVHVVQPPTIAQRAAAAGIVTPDQQK